MDDYVSSEKIHSYFAEINRTKIKYVLIKNIASELPNYLKNEKDIDIVIFLDNKEEFASFQEDLGFKQVIHPWSKKNGWEYLYGLEDFTFWEIRDENQCLRVDVSYALACKGLMPNTWIPLDKKIQQRMWKCRIWDEENKWWITDIDTRFVYYIVRCIFDKQEFNDKYIKEIESALEQIDHKAVKAMLELIFFKYTDRLMDMIKRKEYEAIRNDYISFSDY